MNGNFVRVYVQTFDESLAYSGTFIEITEDVVDGSAGKIKQKIDNSTYDVGLFNFTDLSLELRNDHGRYSAVGNLESIFTFRRTDSIVKVTWNNGPDDYPMCGIAICGEDYLAGEVNVFYGLLNDIASTQNIRDQKIKFSVQGLESIFEKVETNYSDLDVGDTLSDTVFNLLNQTKLTDLMTVSSSNISLDIDQIPDSIASLEETTVKEALDQILLVSNSILYISVSDQTVYVKPREASATVCCNFYGQSSDNGSENIVDIKNISTGNNRIFNFMKWRDTTITSKDASSILSNGVRKKEISSDILTNSTKQGNVLDSYKDEFRNPKQELTLISYLNPDTVNLFFLDRVSVDYPTVFYPFDGGTLPKYEAAKYGEVVYPAGAFALTISTETNYKVMGRSLNIKKGEVEFLLREI